MAYTWAFSAGVKRELTPTMAASIDYVGNRGTRQHRGDRHQRGPGQSGDRPRHPARRERVRSGRRARAARGARRDVRAVQPEPDDGARLRARQQLQLARARTREAAVEPLVGPRQLHAVALLRRRLDHRRQRSAARLRPLRSRQHPRVRDQRLRRHRQGLWRRHRVPRVFGLPDQRDGRHRRQRRRHQQRSADERRERHRGASVGSAEHDPVGGGFDEAWPCATASTARSRCCSTADSSTSPGSASTRPGCSWRSTTC